MLFKNNYLILCILWTGLSVSAAPQEALPTSPTTVLFSRKQSGMLVELCYTSRSKKADPTTQKITLTQKDLTVIKTLFKEPQSHENALSEGSKNPLSQAVLEILDKKISTSLEITFSDKTPEILLEFVFRTTPQPTLRCFASSEAPTLSKPIENLLKSAMEHPAEISTKTALGIGALATGAIILAIFLKKQPDVLVKKQPDVLVKKEREQQKQLRRTPLPQTNDAPLTRQTFTTANCNNLYTQMFNLFNSAQTTLNDAGTWWQTCNQADTLLIPYGGINELVKRLRDGTISTTSPLYNLFLNKTNGIIKRVENAVSTVSIYSRNRHGALALHLLLDLSREDLYINGDAIEWTHAVDDARD